MRAMRHSRRIHCQLRRRFCQDAWVSHRAQRLLRRSSVTSRNTSQVSRALVACLLVAASANAQEGSGATAPPASTEWIPEEPPDQRPIHIPDKEFEMAGDAAPRSRFTERAMLLEGRVGYGTTVGFLGVVGEYSLFDRLALGGGVGLNDLGPVWGIHARLRPIVMTAQSGRRLHAITLESAISQGHYAGSEVRLMPTMRDCSIHDTSGCRTQVSSEFVSWLQFDIGWEMRAPSGFSLRVSYGFATRLNSPNWQCTVLGVTSSCGDETVARTIPTLTVALGYAF